MNHGPFSGQQMFVPGCLVLSTLLYNSILHQNCFPDGQLVSQVSFPQHHALSDHFSHFTKFNNFKWISTAVWRWELPQLSAQFLFSIQSFLTQTNLWISYKAPKANRERSGKCCLFHFTWMCFVSKQTRIITEADWVIFIVTVFPSVAKKKAPNSFHVHLNINNIIYWMEHPKFLLYIQW